MAMTDEELEQAFIQIDKDYKAELETARRKYEAEVEAVGEKYEALAKAVLDKHRKDFMERVDKVGLPIAPPLNEDNTTYDENGEANIVKRINEDWQ